MILRYPLNIEEIKNSDKASNSKAQTASRKIVEFYTNYTKTPNSLIAKYNKLPKFTKPTMGIRAK